MKTSEPAPNAPRPIKAELSRTKPDRGGNGIYLNGGDRPHSITGVPLSTAEATMVAAVRMAYDVADAQIAQGQRLARRLQAKGGDEAIDAASRMVVKAAMAGLEWMETATGVEEGLFQRFMTLFGADASDWSTKPKTAEAAAAAPPPPRANLPNVKIVSHDVTKRPVRILVWDLPDGGKRDLTAYFYCPQKLDGTALVALIKLDPVADNRRTLTMKEFPSNATPGLWRGAACDAAGEQIGIVEIEI